jgi:surfactin family lipopeptide synthetase C
MDRKNVEDLYPLSPMQQGMLFHTLEAPGSGVYFEQMSCTLRGALDAPAFERAWQEVVRRHSILRTAISGEALKEPVQVVQRQVALPFSRQDWRQEGEPAQLARLESFLESDRRRGFDLSRAPLIHRADLVHELVWSYHHLLLDGWSVPMLLQDVFALYEAYRRGYRRSEPLLLQPRRPFRDYIVWLRRQGLSDAEGFWRRTLAGFAEPTSLAVGQGIEDGGGRRFADLEIRLPAQTTSALQGFARRHGLTLSTVVQGAWALLLGRYTGRRDVVFGVTVSGRPADLPGAESMLGLFINTLPLRVDVPEETPLASWLQSLQVRALEMRQFEHSPLSQIQTWSEMPRGTPLFESILVFENYPLPTALAECRDSLSIGEVRSQESTNYPLTVVAGVDERLTLRIVHDAARFDEASVRGMLQHLEVLLEGMAAAPGRPVGEVPLLRAQERRTLEAWALTAGPEPAERTAQQLFEAQVARSPEAVAIAFEGERLTYRELDRRANRIAHHLCALGVGPETVVGLCLPASLDAIASLLGVVKAGGAWLPLDPAYPPERLAYMLEDSGAPLLVTQRALAERLCSHGARIVCLDDAATAEAIARASDADPEVKVGRENLAYVIYTSGSTGKPKGALLHHRGLCNLAHAAVRLFGFGPSSRVLQFASLGFDASVLDVFSAFAAGAALHLGRREVLTSVEDLRRLLQEEAITAVTLPPSVLALLSPEELPGLATVISAGEACPPDVARRWERGRRFFNGYGPTETTVGATFHLVEGTPDGAARIPIGRPIANVRTYVLDAEQRLLPVAVPGELYVGGVGVGRGYLNRPDLTAERFVSDPFAGAPGARMYRTGDRARWLPDGNLEYLGRLDDQVKVRGFRIEPGEIEAALGEHPRVRQAAVLARAHGGDTRLAAYVVPAGGPPLTPAELRDFLRRKVPPYMVPAAFVLLDELPVTSSGKVDRRALPPVAALAEGRSAIAPRDEWEHRLLQIWEELLEARPIGVRDDFFEMGGHSLLSVRLVAQIQRKLGRRISMAQLYEEPTIEHLAQLLRSASPDAGSLVPLRPNGARPPLFFVHPSGGSVHWYGELGRCLAPDQPFYGLQAIGLDGSEPLHGRIEDMAAHYVRAVRERQPVGPYQLGSWSMGVAVAFEMAQQLVAQGEEVSLLAMLDQGPILPLPEPADDAEYLVATYGEHVPLSLERLRRLEPDAQVAHVWEAGRKAQWVLPEVTLDQFRHFVRILRTHTEAWRRYRPAPYPGSITLFRARDRSGDRMAERDLGWGRYAARGVTVHDVPGDHVGMMYPPHVAAVGRRLQACIDEGATRLVAGVG